VACKKWFEQLDRCHIVTRASSGQGFEDRYWIHMCRICHTIQGHLSWSRFLVKYPHLHSVLRAKGYALVDELGVKKMRKIV